MAKAKNKTCNQKGSSKQAKDDAISLKESTSYAIRTK